MHSSSFVFAISLLMLAPFQAYAGTTIQTDWSGGDGIWGPVIDWGNEYYADTDIECYIDPSNAILQKTMSLIPLKHTVDGDFTGAWSVHSADVNGDGCMDVLGAANVAGDIAWWENLDGSGTSWTELIIDGDFTATRSVYSADINGDGYMDVLGASMGLSDITWWENLDGSGTSWTEHIVDGNFSAAISVCAADVNADGYIDVLGAAYSGNDITWWENLDGSGTSWTEHTVDGTFGGAYSVFSADINGDGYMDVLGAAAYDDDITWWENVDGSGTSWTEQVVDGDFDFAASVYSADFNGDGYMDILGAAADAHDITWWENLDGSGTSWTEHIVDGDFDGPFSVFSADVNGDGYLDVLGTSNGLSEIAWWDLTEFLPDGSLESSVLDVQESPDWETIDWTCAEPSGTSVSFQVRASDNSSSMGAWSDTLSGPCTLEGILADEDNYFQYRAILTTTDPLFSPELHDVTVGWQPFNGTQEGSVAEVVSFALFGAQPNPAFGSARISFAVPEMSPVEFSIYGLTGRVTVVLAQDEYIAGNHQVQLGELAPGIYFCRMVSGEFTATQRFVVIE